jgi:hypothetical protein
MADLYYALLLKDAGCSSNASQIYNALASDDIAAKRGRQENGWTRLRWEAWRDHGPAHRIARENRGRHRRTG